MRQYRQVLSLLILPLCLAACSTEEGSVGVIRLVDHFSGDLVEPSPTQVTVPESFEWRFDGEEPAWSAPRDVEDARLEGGLLVGRSTSPLPVIELRTEAPLGVGDQLYAVEVRARAATGTTLSLLTLSGESMPADEIKSRSPRPFSLSTPLIEGDEVQTYTIQVARSFVMGDPLARSGIERLLLAPTNEPGAEFAIESVRLVFRKEFLAGVPSGIGWHGLSEIYRETVVSRSPERVRFAVELPARPWLDLAVGTVETRPVSFRVEVAAAGEQSGETVLHRVVTRPEQWEPARIDLARWDGQRVDLLLSTEADEAGALGMWGTVAVRSSRSPTTTPEAPQGVIVFLGDTLRRDHLPMYGYDRDTAPNLARLAAAGALFLDATSQGTWTKVSVPSILSSTYPAANGIRDFTDRLPSSAVTLAEAFRDAGYATFATSSVAFSGQLTNLQQGVEQLHERGSYKTPDDLSSAKTARVFNDRMLSWIEDHRDVPFFAFLHVMDPHSPYQPYPPYDTLWAASERAATWKEEVDTVRPLIKSEMMRGFGMPTREELLEAGISPEAYVAHEHDWYDGSIRGMDAEIGRIMARLDELGIAENTLFAFVSDHGEEFLDHGRHWHGFNVYGETTGVPLVLWGPGRVPGGATVATPVQLVDLAPTLLDLAGLPVPEVTQGQSLMPLMRAAVEGSSAAELGWQNRPAISQKIAPVIARNEPGYNDAYALLTPEWKLVRNPGPPEGLPLHELYDHRADPLDQTDVAAEHPAKIEELAAQLDRWLEWAEAHRLPSDDETAASLDAGELERLRSLGYIQ